MVLALPNTVTVLLHESAPLRGTGFRLDKDSGIVYGAVICGFKSKNGREYPREVLSRDRKVYEGAQIYIDHKNGERQVREFLGVLRNIGENDQGKPVGEIHYVKNSPFTAEFEERVERFPESFALSHAAVCRTKRRNGVEVIESIQSVESVDLVARGATNKSIKESVMRETIKKYCESIAAKWPKASGVKRLLEMEGMDEMPMPEDAPVVDVMASPDDPIKTAMFAAIRGLVDQMESGETDAMSFVKKAKDLLKAMGKISGSGEAEVEVMDEETYESVVTQNKNLLKENAQLKLESLAASVGVQLTPVIRKAAETLEPAEQKTLLESFKTSKKSTGEKPVAGERRITESVNTTQSSQVPTDGKGFAEYLKGNK